MEIASLPIINWILLDAILVELSLIITISFKNISKNKFWYILASIISIILLIIALAYGVIAVSEIEKNAAELILTGGFY